jgi:hypothetical protein
MSQASASQALQALQALRQILEDTEDSEQTQTQLEHQRQLFRVDPARKSRKRGRGSSQIWRDEAVKKKIK